jgi:YHS domain-containing protein
MLFGRSALFSSYPILNFSVLKQLTTTRNRIMKNFLKAILVTSGLLLSSLAFSAEIDVNADENDLAIKGYDPVAYFTMSQPIKGDVNYTATYKGAIYQFVSEDNRDVFRNNPEKYAPQFGGHCAFGVSMGQKFDTDPTAWKIIEDKLYLNLNAQVQQRWLKNTDALINQANDNWENIALVSKDDL